MTLKEYVDHNIKHRAAARMFIYAFEGALQHNPDDCKKIYEDAAALIDEHKDNAYYLIALLRCPWRLRDQLPTYWADFKKVHDYLVVSQGENGAKRVLVGIYQEAVRKGVV